MGRHINHKQRSHLPANRELRRAISADRPKSFGIRRLVEEQMNNKFIATWDFLQDQGDIPENIEPRLETGVTLLPRSVLGKQLTQGLVLGYKLGNAQANLNRDMELAGKESTIEVKCGEVAMFHRRIVYIEIESEELRAERQRIFSILGNLGFRGAHRSLSKPLHVTLGESDKFVTKVEERHVVHTLNENLDNTGMIQLQEWQIYPSVDQVTEVNPDDY